MAAIMFIMLAAAAGQDSIGTSTVPEDWDFGYSALVQAGAGGTWVDGEPVADTTSFDAAFSVHALSKEVDLLAVAASGSDRSGEMFLRRGRASVRWPGTPWIGGSVHYGDGLPFVPGLGPPLVEWGWVDPDSLSGFGVSGGGILGFSADYLLQEAGDDTLEQFMVSSPWLGFAGADYYRMELVPGDSISSGGLVMNAVAVRTDLRYASPWLVIAGGEGREGRWAVSGEIRDFSPIDTRWGSIELVPGIDFTGDSLDLPSCSYTPGRRVVSMAAYLNSRRYMFSAGVKGMADLESDSLSGASMTAGMVSEGGVTWDLMLDIFADGDYSGLLSSRTSDSFASAGLMLEVVNDSSRVTGSASYSPRRDVCAQLSVSGDLDDSLEPSCAAAVSAALGPVRALLEVDWKYDAAPVYRLDLRGLLE